MLDRPFTPPLDIEIALPPPPSLNSIWVRGKKSVYLSKHYVLWKKAADHLSMLTGQCRGVETLRGKFEVHIILDNKQNGDIDNKIKVLLDWCQSRELISNDKNCIRIVAEYGDAPHGCRLILRSREPN